MGNGVCQSMARDSPSARRFCPISLKFDRFPCCEAALGAYTPPDENFTRFVPFFFIFTLSLSFEWGYNDNELKERSVIGRWIPFPNEVNTIEYQKRAFGKLRFLAARGKAKGVTLP